jgi:proteasome lid subunit RPN8/RPN11
MIFGKAVDEAARAHALSEFPRESCGVVVNGAYVAVSNIASKPEEDFRMADNTWTLYGAVQGVVHSHGPKDALIPSANDMAHQISTNVPWGIVRVDGVAASKVLWWGDFRLDEPLIGREFVHGITDCYSAIRSWRWQTDKIKLPDFARDWLWWESGADLYEDNFAKAGYRAIKASEASLGDVALINFRSKVPNHAGTLVEDELFYHHLQNRLSCREPLGRWHSMISKWLRYEG